MESTLVVFDIGGVLIRLRHTWDDILAFLEEPPLDREKPWRQADYSPLSAYQDGSMPEEAYVAQVAQDLRLAPERAREAHAAMLGTEYPGTEELIADLIDAGVRTACLSNTNALHWESLNDPSLYPGIGSLSKRFASFEIRVNKPLPEAFRAVEAAFPGVERRILFDDLPDNVEGAKAAGWEAHRIDPDGDPPAQMRAILIASGILEA